MNNSITEKSTVIASRCPECGAIIAERINIFTLSSKHHTIRCKVCGKGAMAIDLSADGKIRLQVPCLICAHSHPYTLSSDSFFDKELFLLQCSNSGLDTCFIGEEAKVDEALRLNAKQLKEIYDANNKEAEQQNFLDVNVMQEVMYAVEELAITNRIKCRCKEPNLAIVVDYDKVRISCKDCGAKTVLYATEESDIEKVSEMKTLELL